MKNIINETRDEERAYYGERDLEAANITIAGPADGESAFKECRNIAVRHSAFSLRYPFWHNIGLSLEDCAFDSGVRAPLWYCKDVQMWDMRVEGVKALRECSAIHMRDSMFRSDEFGWNCRRLDFDCCGFESSYFLMNSENIRLKRCRLDGKYSFQYVRDAVLEDCELDTKDAFWHAKNVTLRNCTVKGEYLAWYSENLTLENCTVIGTQPFCYCKGLRLVRCRMIDTDLAFEYSEVEADIEGTVLSVKNPSAGKIVADGYGDIILGGAVRPTECEIVTRK